MTHRQALSEITAKIIHTAMQQRVKKACDFEHRGFCMNRMQNLVPLQNVGEVQLVSK